MTPKNGNGAQKNVHIFKSSAPILLKLCVGLDHMYTKDWIFFHPAAYIQLKTKQTQPQGGIRNTKGLLSNYLEITSRLLQD